jgi:hypothetical protein
MTRIRRTFIAAVAATAVTASMGMGASQSVAGGPEAIASACTYSAWKITKRENVSCRKAKKVLKGEYGNGDKVAGWNCTNNGNLIPEGKCTKGQRSFKYKPQ